jgi:hypothetical protein
MSTLAIKIFGYFRRPAIRVPIHWVHVRIVWIGGDRVCGGFKQTILRARQRVTPIGEVTQIRTDTLC